jgi:hypothetical protein
MKSDINRVLRIQVNKIKEDLGAANKNIGNYLAREEKRIRILGFGPHPGNVRNAKELKKAFDNLIAIETTNLKALTEAIKASMLEFCPVTKGHFWEQYQIILSNFIGKTGLFGSEFQKEIFEKINSQEHNKSPAKSVTPVVRETEIATELTLH